MWALSFKHRCFLRAKPPPASSISKPNLPAVLVCSSYSEDKEESGVQETDCFFPCFPALGMHITGHELLTPSQHCSCCIKVGVANACKSLLALVLMTSVQVCSLHMPGEKHLSPSMWNQLINQCIPGDGEMMLQIRASLVQADIRALVLNLQGIEKQ